MGGSARGVDKEGGEQPVMIKRIENVIWGISVRQLLCLARNSVILVRSDKHGNETSGSREG
jgi:hypothetical protein